MNDSILNDPGTKIDARPLIEGRAIHGAVVGFVCSLLAAVPLGLLVWKELPVGAGGAIAIASLVVAVGTCIPALVCAYVGHEMTLTDEQRAIISKHQRRALTVANYFATPSTILLIIGCHFTGMYILIFPAFCIKLACLIVASLVGRGNGKAVVAEMRRSVRLTAGATGGRWADDRPPSPACDAGPERGRLRLSDRDRVADTRRRSGESQSFGDLGDED